MSFDRFRIGARLGFGFAIVLALVALMAALGAWRLGSVAGDTAQMMAVPLVKERLANEWFRNLSIGLRRTAAIVKSSDASLESFFAEEIKASTARGSEILKSIEVLPASDEERRLLAQITEKRKAYLVARDSIMKSKREGRADEAERLFAAEFTPASRTYVESMQAFLDYQSRSIDTTGAQIQSSASSARTGLSCSQHSRWRSALSWHGCCRARSHARWPLQSRSRRRLPPAT